jgi:hypothetical protein
MRGNLPWQGVKVQDKKEKYEMIKQKKTDIPLEELCTGIPKQFVEFMEMCRAVGFEDRPDYDKMRALFKDLFYSLGFEYDFNFDWIIKQRSDKLKMLKQKQPIEKLETLTIPIAVAKGSSAQAEVEFISPRSDN